MFKSKSIFEQLLWCEETILRYGDVVCDTCGHPLAAHIKWCCYPHEVRPRDLLDEELSGHLGVKDTNPKDAIGSKKAPMSTLPAGVLAEMGVAMLEGKAKYGAFNYRVAGVRASVYYDALWRHIAAWWEGEDIDAASGMPHIVKALTTLAVLRDAQRNGMVTDDRPPISLINYDDLNAKSAAIIEMHRDKSPRHYTRDDKIGGSE